MKELSIEQKAKAYDEALSVAKETYITQPMYRECLAKMFPKLAESEDEKIRKRLIGHLRECRKQCRSEVMIREYAEWIAWLEKMCEQKPTLPKWKYKNDNTPLLRDSIILNKYGCVAKSPSGAIVSDVWVIDYDELAKLPKEEFEKQKDVETVEPKFKVGDWIIHNTNTDCTNSLMRISKVSPKEYICKYTYGQMSYRHENIDKNYRLWTIQDAKDGDVLVDKDNNIGLYQEEKNKAYWNSCIYIGCDNSLRVFGGYHEYENTKPATKEQCDLLFSKMHEAGYEWDAEKKELKKIEQTQEDASELCDLSDFESDLFTVFRDAWQQYLHGEEVNVAQWAKEHSGELLDTAKKELCEQNHTWSEEDEKKLNILISNLVRIGASTRTDSTSVNYTFAREIDWLKSLKDRYAFHDGARST